jgi:hypothetical protein
MFLLNTLRYDFGFSRPTNTIQFFINVPVEQRNEERKSRWGHLLNIYGYGPGVDSASNRNRYQECLLGVKAAGP